MKHVSGIYQIRNTRTNQRYIGSTRNFFNREKSHFRRLRLGTHTKVLQKAFDSENDKSVFVFEVLAVYPKNFIVEIEQLFLDELKPAYNTVKLAMGGDWYSEKSLEEKENFSETMRIRTTLFLSDPINREIRRQELKAAANRPEVIEKNRKTKKDLWAKPETVIKSRKVMGARLGVPVINVTTGEVFESMAEAARAHGFKSYIGIWSCCRGTLKTSGGFIWRYFNNDELNEKADKIRANKTNKRKVIKIA